MSDDLFLFVQRRSHLIDVEARVLWFVPVTSKELMHFCVINKAIIIFVVVTVVPASITLAFLDSTKTKQCGAVISTWAFWNL